MSINISNNYILNMSNKEDIKISKLYSISDLKGYYYKLRSSWREDLWGYHDPEYGHSAYSEHVPNIIKVKNTQDDLERYPEIMDNFVTHDPNKRTKFDVDSPVLNIVGNVPDMGIEVIEMTSYYHCGDLTEGLFVYYVESLSKAFYAGFNVGDVITAVKRPEVEKIKVGDKKVYRSYDIKNVKDLMSILNVIRPNENLIFVISRNEQQIELNLSIPVKVKVYQRITNPKIVIKRCPDLYISDDGNLIMNWNENDYTSRVFNLISADVDNDLNLVMEVPDTLTGYDFDIDENGNLVIYYE